jgi:hypothetical protein
VADPAIWIGIVDPRFCRGFSVELGQLPQLPGVCFVCCFVGREGSVPLSFGGAAVNAAGLIVMASSAWTEGRHSRILTPSAGGYAVLRRPAIKNSVE